VEVTVKRKGRKTLKAFVPITSKNSTSGKLPRKEVGLSQSFSRNF
jgi:hypothetical protein